MSLGSYYQCIVRMKPKAINRQDHPCKFLSETLLETDSRLS